MVSLFHVSSITYILNFVSHSMGALYTAADCIATNRRVLCAVQQKNGS